MDLWEQRLFEMIKRGQKDRIKYLNDLHKSIIPSHVRRIQQNDKTVLKELVLPPWLNWDLLYEWSQQRRIMENARECILCNELSEHGMEFKEKFICENCFLKLKNLK